MDLGPSLGTIEPKVVVLGETGVGKTAIVQRFVHDTFAKTEPTVGASFFTKHMNVNGVSVSLHIWDTAGQERFRSLAPMYYHGSSAALLIYDLCDPSSFPKVKDWARGAGVNCDTRLSQSFFATSLTVAFISELQTNVSEPIGAKLDCWLDQAESLRTESNLPKMASLYAQELGAVCYETSSKMNKGITPLFIDLVKRIIAVQNQQLMKSGRYSARDIVQFRESNDALKHQSCRLQC